MNKLSGIVIALALSCAKGHVAYWNTPNQLHPVQGLYVKPSIDGTTGDLYVAATEESGVKSQWLTDQPVNFLPAQQITYSSSFTNLPHDETSVATQKRAVVTSPAMHYAYALPGAPTDSATIPYGYTAPSVNPPVKPVEETTECTGTPIPNYPQYFPYHYYYPHMMAAFANAVNTLKESETSEDDGNLVKPQVPPFWPYSYPFHYMMMNPAAWAQSQTAATAPTQLSSSSSTAVANDEVKLD